MASSPWRRGARWLLAFGLWTAFVWTTRIGTLLAEDDLSAGARTLRMTLVLSFTAVAGIALVVWWRTRRRAPTRGEAGLVLAGCAWTIGVWVLRSIQIPLAGHDGGFVIVHWVLAAVSIALAVSVARTTTMPPRHGTAGHRRAEADVTR